MCFVSISDLLGLSHSLSLIKAMATEVAAAARRANET